MVVNGIKTQNIVFILIKKVSCLKVFPFGRKRNIRRYRERILSSIFPLPIATIAIHNLSDYLCRYYGKKVIILLDEYDTPMQEAYVHGFWDELVVFTRSMFNSTFKM